jgi:hypothetical protein
MRTSLKLLVACVVLFSAADVAAPATMEEMKAAVNALEARLQAQQGRLEELETRAARDGRLEIAKVARELAADAAKRRAAPQWLDNLTFHGDFRLRYQGDCAEDRNDTRRSKNRSRARFRLRFGLIKTWLDEQLTVGFRLASGDRASSGVFEGGGTPTSTNQTFTGLFGRKEVWIDRAYAIYRPKAIKGLTIAGGKLGVPFVQTDLIWDSDVNVEGFWAQYAKAFGPIEPFVNAGYFLGEDDYAGDSQYDTVLMFYQLGTNWEVVEGVRWTFAASYYDYDHTDIIPSGEFQMINLTNTVDFKLFKLPWSAYVDYVHNCENKLTSGDEESQDDGLAVGLTVGKNKKKGDWSASYKYAYIETYCTPGLLNDADFGHTNVRGHVVRAEYNLTDFLTFGGSVFLCQRIAGFEKGVEFVTTQVELVWKF